MNTQQVINEACISWLVHNKPTIKLLVKPLEQQRKTALENNIDFKDDIENEFNSIVKSTLAIELTKHLQITPEDAMIFVEQLNISAYLR